MNVHALLLCSILTIASSCHAQVKYADISPGMTGSIGKVVTEMDKSIWVIFQDRKNNYWFGSNGNGVYRYDGKTLTRFTTKDGLYSNQIRGIQQDKSGNIYFEAPGGVSKFDGGKFIALTPVKSPVNQWILQPDDLWFKTTGDAPGACRYDGKALYQLEFAAFGTKDFNPNYAVYSIYKDKQGNIWFGTLTAGVCRFNGSALDWINETELAALEDGRAPAIRSILEDKDGYFWFSNILYQYRIRDNAGTPATAMPYERVKKMDLSKQEQKMELPYYTSAVVDNESIWMTNYNEGVWKYDGNKLSNYRLKDKETNVLTMFVYKDNAGALWLATDNSGVYTFNGRAFEKFKP
jgi:ligand-binding sensor domain-containing protein